jgi:hypothetical protein
VNARIIFDGDDAAKTRAYYAALERRGAIGEFAANLMRAQKASTRAKRYRGGISGVGSFSDLAYERKAECLIRLCDSLLKGDGQLLYDHRGPRWFQGNCETLRWGWKIDPRPRDPRAKWVLYIDLPHGQVSFHSTERFGGPDYPAEFDGAHASAERIISFCDFVFMNPPQGQLPLPQQLPL